MSVAFGRDVAKREQLEACSGLLPESQDPNLGLTVLYVPCSLDSGTDVRVCSLGVCRVRKPETSEH